MASRGFARAMNEATFSVSVGTNGMRSIDRRGNNNNNNETSQRTGMEGRWQRGGGFRRGRSRGRGRGRGRGGFQSRSRFGEDEDGDADMDDDGRYNSYRNRGGRDEGRRDRSPDGRQTNSDWFKVTIPEGRKHNRDWLLNKIRSLSKKTFQEVNFHCYQDNAVFFVKGKSLGDAIQRISGVITTRDATKLLITVRPSPHAPVDGHQNNLETETNTQKLDIFKQFLGSRYNTDLVQLDLSNVYADRLLTEKNVEKRITNHRFMNTILKIVHSICPQLKSLDLSNNRIVRLDILQSLSEMCPELEELKLSQNYIRFSGELKKIASISKLRKLWLGKNPLVEEFGADTVAYYSEVRKKLPNIEELDGAVLPKAIKFDLQTESHLPAIKPGYCSNPEALKLIATFVENYFKVYDSDDANCRQQLLAAYHNDAVFSLSLCASSDEQWKSMSIFERHNRNLKRVKDRKKRQQLIKQKKLAVVAYLTELPTTKHKLDSFVLDVPAVTPAYILFTINGVFTTADRLYAFTRVFVAVPESNAQFLIINDQLHVQSTTEAQQRKYVQSTEKYSTEQQEMVKKFSSESKMNMQWSLDCLASNEWNFQRAATKFSELNGGGQIPPEAFVMT